MNNLEQWKQDLENYYRNLFFMDPKHKNDWQEAARQAAESQYQAELLKRQISVNLPEVIVTAQAPVLKQVVAVESDWDPGYTKFMSAPEKNAIRYNPTRASYIKGLDRYGYNNLGNLAAGAVAFPAVAIGGAHLGGQGVPALMRGVKAFRAAHPIISGAIDAGLTVDGVRNALSDNGVLKTINYAKDGNWGRAAVSGTIDALDLLGGVGLINDVYKLVKPYAKGVFSRTAEAILREGDYLKDSAKNWLGQYGKYKIPILGVNLKESMFPTWKLLFNRKTLNYIFNPKADPNLAYQMPYRYSGQHVLDDSKLSLAHKNDLIDVAMGKSDILMDDYGKIIGEVSKDTRYIPLSTLDNFSELTDQMRVLRPTNNARQTPSTSSFLSQLEAFDARDLAIREGKMGQELFRSDWPWIKIADPGESIGSFYIDPGHFGYSVWPTPENPYQLVGNDLYHYNLRLFGKTHLHTQILPNINFSKPLIVQWPIDVHKSGGIIHIKKENRGKFTDYCGGKVTEECIRKGKNSSNPTTRKRANFAWVARHKFKHEEGGKLNYLNYFN